MNNLKKAFNTLVVLLLSTSLPLLSSSGFEQLSKEYTRIIRSWQKHPVAKRSEYRANRDKALNLLLKKLDSTPPHLLLKTRVLLHLNKTGDITGNLKKVAEQDKEKFYSNDINILAAIYNIKKSRYSAAEKNLSMLSAAYTKGSDYYSVCLALALKSKSVDSRIKYGKELLNAGTAFNISIEKKAAFKEFLGELYFFKGMKDKASELLNKDTMKTFQLQGSEAPVLKPRKWYPSTPVFGNFKNRITVLHFWNPSSDNNTESLKQLSRMTRGNKDINVTCISRIKGRDLSGTITSNPSDEIKEIKEKYSSQFPSMKFHASLNGIIFSDFSVKKLPVTIIIDKAGKIDVVTSGSIPAEEINKRIGKLSEVKYGTN